MLAAKGKAALGKENGKRIKLEDKKLIDSLKAKATLVYVYTVVFALFATMVNGFLFYYGK